MCLKNKMKAVNQAAHHDIVQPLSSKKENPFGSAKPREEVLARKGIDFHTIDNRIEKKSDMVHFSREQDIQLRRLENDLVEAEEKLRDANERELPEEKLKKAVENKRRALNDLMSRFKIENEGKDVIDIQRTFERPSVRRRRRYYDQNRSNESGYYHQRRDNYNEDQYSSFHRKENYWYGYHDREGKR